MYFLGLYPSTSFRVLGHAQTAMQKLCQPDLAFVCRSVFCFGNVWGYFIISNVNLLLARRRPQRACDEDIVRLEKNPAECQTTPLL